MAQNPQAPRTVTMTEFSPEILVTILSYLPQKDVIDNVSRTCKMWRDVARSLHTSLKIPMELKETFEHNSYVTPEKISKLLKKTTRLEKLAIEISSRASETGSDLFSRFLVSQLKEMETWRQNFPKTMSSFTITYKNMHRLVPCDDRIHFDKAILLHFQKILDLLGFQLETISFDRSMLDILAEFCRTESRSNCQKGLSLTMKGFDDTVTLEKFLNFSRDNLQKIDLWNCHLSRDIMLSLKTLPSLKDLSLCANGYLEDFKFLFDKSCQLRDLEFLEVVGMGLDVEAVRNVGKCCGNSLRHLSITSDTQYGSNSDEWFTCLKSFSALKECKFSGFTMSPEHWNSIFGCDGGLKNLKSLELSSVKILSASAFAKIAEFSGDTLKTLRVWASRPLVSPQDCAKHVRRLHALEELEIGGGCFENYTRRKSFFDKLFGTGSHLTGLKSFRLDDKIHLNESWIARLENCCGKNLKTLDLQLDEGETSDASLCRLKHFSKLEVLAIEGNSPGIGFSTVAWSNLFDGQSELNNLRDVSLPYTDVDDDCLKNLAKLCGRKLKKLDVLGCEDVTPSGIDVVNKMCGSGIELRHDGDYCNYYDDYDSYDEF